MSELADFEALFQSLNIDYSSPGFYDDPQFVEMENQNPNFLHSYADYIETLSFSKEYLRGAREGVQSIASYLHSELVVDGRRGACLDVSGVMSRFLEQQGIWNYIVKGSVTIDFVGRLAVPTQYLWHFVGPTNPAKAGHAWVCAPPFKVLDLTVFLQKYRRAEDATAQEEARGFVAIETANKEPVEFSVSEIVEPEFVAAFGRLPTLDELKNFDSSFKLASEKLLPFNVDTELAALKYIPCGVTAPDLPLQEMKNLRLSGKYPIDLFDEFTHGSS